MSLITNLMSIKTLSLELESLQIKHSSGFIRDDL